MNKWIINGDCVEAMRRLVEAGVRVDSIVTDPPYFLESIVKRFGGKAAAPAQFGKDGAFSRQSHGFMNQTWDSPDTPSLDPAFASWLSGFIDGEGCFSVHKKEVNGYTTYDCQFSLSLRDDDSSILYEARRQMGGIGSINAHKTNSGNPQVRWCVSSKEDCLFLREVLLAFPLRAKKSRDFILWSNALDEWVVHKNGSSWERIAYLRDRLMAVKMYGSKFNASQVFHYRWATTAYDLLKPGGYVLAFSGTRTYHRLAAALEDAGFIIHPMIAWIFGQGFPKAHAVEDDAWKGWAYGTQSLKPGLEPICMAQKPMSERTGTANVLEHGTGAINIDGCRVGDFINTTPAGQDRYNANNAKHGYRPSAYEKGEKQPYQGAPGRWPANVIHDGSDEVLESFAGYGETTSTGGRASLVGMQKFRGHEKPVKEGAPPPGYGDTGSVSRYFYCAKAGANDRVYRCTVCGQSILKAELPDHQHGLKGKEHITSHPTTKPISLMRYLTRLVTPPGGLVLDPFSGSGTTLKAADEEGFMSIGIEKQAEYVRDIVRRLRG